MLLFLNMLFFLFCLFHCAIFFLAQHALGFLFMRFLIKKFHLELLIEKFPTEQWLLSSSGNTSNIFKGHVGGHRGQKGHFTKNATPTDYRVWSRDSCTCITFTPSTKVITLKIIRGHLGSLESKGHFYQKCYNSSMLHSMTIRLIHVDQLEILYLCYGVKCQSGVFGSLGSKGHFH